VAGGIPVAIVTGASDGRRNVVLGVEPPEDGGALLLVEPAHHRPDHEPHEQVPVRSTPAITCTYVYARSGAAVTAYTDATSDTATIPPAKTGFARSAIPPTVPVVVVLIPGRRHARA
jgi:hypothetical protein